MVSVWVMPVRAAMRPVTTEAKLVVLPYPDGDEVGPAGDGADLGQAIRQKCEPSMLTSRLGPSAEPTVLAVLAFRYGE